VRTVEQTRAVLVRKLTDHWHTWVTSTDAFPLVLPLGRADATDLASDFSQTNREALAWAEFARNNAVEVRWANRKVRGSTQELATHLVVPNLEVAAAIAGGTWSHDIARARRRWAVLHHRFRPRASSTVLRAVNGYTDVDFDILLATGSWLEANDPTGLTARQVPVEGVHSKWLNTHRRELLALSGRESLGLVERGTLVRYSYLDPAHRRAGRRWHDSHVLGDSSVPLYDPQIAVISENKDTAQLFGELDGAISIHGSGFAAVSQLPDVPWLSKIPALFYWGDLDAEGFEILDGLRASGLRVSSLLMDEDAYEVFERYGTDSEADGRRLAARPLKLLAHLTPDEHRVYARLVDPAWSGTRRIEQERIPLAHALATLKRLLPR
jgi:hypothetical protein